MVIPFFDSTRQYLKIRSKINASVARVLRSGKFILGKENALFENAFAAYIGTRYGVGVNSGTDALKIALRSLGIKPGDEVITVANTAVPTVSAIRETGAIPVFVDINEYFTINANTIEQAITRKTKAIIPVHLYGQPCDMAVILKIAKKHGLKIIEDCAQATGAKIKNKKVGSFGDIACFSFYPTKNLGAYGDGGMIVTSNKKLADTARRLRMYGMEKTYSAREEWYNSRLDELQAAILNMKLSYLDGWNVRRKEIARYYFKNIKNKHIALPRLKTGYSHAFHLFVIRTKVREQLERYLKQNGVGYGIHYPFPIHRQKAYGFLGYKKGELPATERAAKEVLSLPVFPELTDKELRSIVAKINTFKS